MAELTNCAKPARGTELQHNTKQNLGLYDDSKWPNLVRARFCKDDPPCYAWLNGGGAAVDQLCKTCISTITDSVEASIADSAFE